MFLVEFILAHLILAEDIDESRLPKLIDGFRRVTLGGNLVLWDQSDFEAKINKNIREDGGNFKGVYDEDNSNIAFIMTVDAAFSAESEPTEDEMVELTNHVLFLLANSVKVDSYELIQGKLESVSTIDAEAKIISEDKLSELNIEFNWAAKDSDADSNLNDILDNFQIDLNVGVKPCPSLKCWSHTDEDGCMLKENVAGCSDLVCTESSMDITFGHELFDTSEIDDLKWIGITWDDVKFLPETNNFDVSCTFDGHCGMITTFETINGVEKLVITIEISPLTAKMPLLLETGLKLEFSSPNPKVTLQCSYSTVVELDSEYVVKHATVAGAVSAEGALDEGFTMIMTGSEYIGETKTVAVNWAVTMPEVTFYLTDCYVNQASYDIHLIKDTCISNVLDVTKKNPTDFSSVIAFSYVSFGVSGASGDTQTNWSQTLHCSLKLCHSSQTDCGLKEACPLTGDDAVYQFRHFRHY